MLNRNFTGQGKLLQAYWRIAKKLDTVMWDLYQQMCLVCCSVEYTNTRYLHARFGLMEPNATNVGASFFSFYLELLRYIEHNWEMLVHDIETGTIDSSVKMSEEVKASLEKKLQPMPERAQELRKIFSEGFDEPFVPKVWQKMCYLQGVGTGGFKTYADKIRDTYTDSSVKQLKMGISASEGLLSMPFELDSDDSIIVPDSIYQ